MKHEFKASMPIRWYAEEPDCVVTFHYSPAVTDPGGGRCDAVIEDIHVLIDGQDIEIGEDHLFYDAFLCDCEIYMDELDRKDND